MIGGNSCQVVAVIEFYQASCELRLDIARLKQAMWRMHLKEALHSIVGVQLQIDLMTITNENKTCSGSKSCQAGKGFCSNSAFIIQIYFRECIHLVWPSRVWSFRSNSLFLIMNAHFVSVCLKALAKYTWRRAFLVVKFGHRKLFSTTGLTTRTP